VTFTIIINRYHDYAIITMIFDCCTLFQFCSAGAHIGTGEEVAIKLESVRSKHPQLLYESKVLRYLKGGLGLPEGACARA
jgi:hypothetical protein